MPFDSNGLYHLEDIAFANTNQLSEAARTFKKHGYYTRAPKGSREYDQFWNQEEDRLLNGMTIPGKLVTTKSHSGAMVQKIQEVHITGENYGFLNYARIRRTKDQDIEELKKYVTGGGILTKHARKVGKKDLDFPKFIDGQYHWFTAKEVARNAGLHVIIGKARRKGLSYIEGWDSAITVNLNPYVTVIVGAYSYDYITKGNQIMPMAKSYLDFLELHTDFGRGYLKESIEHIKMGYKKKTEGNKEFGYLSELVAVSFMNNPDAAVGKDAVKIKFEECGKFPNLKEALSVTLPTMKDGSIMTGQLIMFGTGGTDEANWADFENIYYHPDKYGCMLCNNIWDEDSNGSGVGFFYPQQVGDPAYIDDNGNSLKELALAEGDREREKNRKTKDASEYIKFLAQEARTPKEAFSSGSDNIFPAAEINDQLARIEHNPDFIHLARTGKIIRTREGLRFKQNVELEHEGLKVHDPITNFPLKDGQDVTGCYVEWVRPFRDPTTGRIPDNLYRLWHDPYAIDKDKKDLTIRDSLGVTYVYERPNNITPTRGDHFIGCYIGRPPRMDDYNQQMLDLCEFVNGKIMSENNRGDVIPFFRNKKKLELLADEPDLIRDIAAQGKTNKNKGIHINDTRKENGIIYLRDWLKESRGKDINGIERLNLHYIYDAALLRELLKWNPKGNFDRVSALIVGMYDMKECVNQEIKMPNKNKTTSIFHRKIFS